MNEQEDEQGNEQDQAIEQSKDAHESTHSHPIAKEMGITVGSVAGAWEELQALSKPQLDRP
jgi:hypothetical protein